MTIQFSSAELPAGRFHMAHAGETEAPLVLCLHGFPESWLAYEAVLEELAQGYHAVAPDQRGFNWSPKPDDPDAYHIRALTGDMFALADHLSPDRPFVLFGHDWGGAVAYAMAFMRPDRISHLIIANGIHPWCFQNAIISDPVQRIGSQYMNKLRSPQAADFMSANGYEKTLRMLSGSPPAPWLTDELREKYIQQWSQPGALEAMLNWYRASPVVVPEPDKTDIDAPLLRWPRTELTVRMPHLVVWGEQDTALTTACLDGLEEFAADLTIRRVADAGHFILHEKPDIIVDAVRAFLDR
jgi:pimeloyl-ACP methyl ester carboxylesterase